MGHHKVSGHSSSKVNFYYVYSCRKSSLWQPCVPLNQFFCELASCCDRQDFIATLWGWRWKCSCIYNDNSDYFLNTSAIIHLLSIFPLFHPSYTSLLILLYVVIQPALVTTTATVVSAAFVQPHPPARHTLRDFFLHHNHIIDYWLAEKKESAAVSSLGLEIFFPIMYRMKGDLSATPTQGGSGEYLGWKGFSWLYRGRNNKGDKSLLYGDDYVCGSDLEAPCSNTSFVSCFLIFASLNVNETTFTRTQAFSSLHFFFSDFPLYGYWSVMVHCLHKQKKKTVYPYLVMKIFCFIS